MKRCCKDVLYTGAAEPTRGATLTTIASVQRVPFVLAVRERTFGLVRPDGSEKPRRGYSGDSLNVGTRTDSGSRACPACST